MQAAKIITFKLNESHKVKQKHTDYSNRSTTSLVMDQRTRLNLYKLQEKRKLEPIEEIINTGKEASVYKSADYAVKIFATSSMIFKNRQIYIDGDRRFRQMNTSCSNSRQLVKLWCEKEYRNMKRVSESNLINCPKPEYVSDTVLVMQLIPNSPRLIDVAKYLTLSRLIKVYYSILRSMRDLFMNCCLVHGDLSEYNLLYQTTTKKVFMIDFGQALDLTNPNAITLLRIDIKNINTFFARLGIPVVENVKVLEFITAPLSTLPTLPTPKNNSEIQDCMSPLAVNPDLVSAVQYLHSTAKQKSYEEIQDDDQFVQTKIFELIKNYSEDDIFRAENAGLKNFGIDIEFETNKTKKEKEKILKERILWLDIQKIEAENINENEELENGEDEEEEENEEEQNILIGQKKINLHKLQREDFTKEEWKEIQAKLKEAKRIARTQKKPKKQKLKERKVAKRKNGGK
ncbi:RIO_kinase 1 [Hexamita inflata]|uniref:non-specific serine/threonine protein kinase n=1 Tax=Hexamita inflata TaxID=28002 RepID=A0AA86PWR1_9EUKA|nr:RIO kinase 1 [Hexamita inflata]